MGPLAFQRQTQSLRYPQAVTYYDQAARQGHVESQRYQQGAGAEQDMVKVTKWLMLAMQNKDKRFVTHHTKMLNYLSAQMTEEQKASAVINRRLRKIQDTHKAC